MTLQRARVIKADPSARPTDGAAAVHVERARRISAEVLEARDEAARIVAAARAEAEAIVASTKENARSEARAEEIARLAASFLALRDEDARRVERDVDRLVELAILLAERLVGEALRIEPTRIAALAASALRETRGARQVQIEAAPDDVAALEAALGAIGQVAKIDADPALRSGSLIVHTDLGRVDARLEPQLVRLAEALREVLR